ncbi:terminase small subunit [Senegalia massiliensis]|uniref:Terminase small subunit n=1 Tax=Senegalia massiliensis TaxID=1720316 RepID=A0A845QZ86_9CLOT|nr:terminase small subunit [Senegalia massiliensis]NBI08267.1 terminase small subunit [Senegalia massiliensis]
MAKKLSAKQKKFADLYIKLGNATQAAIEAGYSKNYAIAQGYKLLDNVGVKTYIDKKLKEIEDKQIAKAEEVLKYLTSIMRGEEKEETLKWIGEGEQAISDIEVSAKDRIKAAELIGKRYGIWKDKVEVDDSITINIKRKGED